MPKEKNIPVLSTMKAALFDLDGVIVDTAKFHYLAWRELANGLGFDISEAQNEHLKGISRMESLDVILGWGKVTLEPAEKERLATVKNGRYVEMIKTIDASEILPGARDYLLALRTRGVKIALGSASKNAEMILKSLGILDLFDAIVDGNQVTKSKPDPQVFALGAQALGVAPKDCIVYEDAVAGVDAAKAAGMHAVGIGKPENLPRADLVVPGLFALLEG